MAILQSAKKRIRRNERRRQINKKRKSRFRTAIKKVEDAIENGDAETAEERFKVMQKEIDRGVAKGVIKKNTASRKKSQLSGRIKALKEKK